MLVFFTFFTLWMLIVVADKQVTLFYEKVLKIEFYMHYIYTLSLYIKFIF